MNNTFQFIKIIVLAFVFSSGLSYVYAWTVPTVAPPAGNASAPLNTSATVQTKTGGLNVTGKVGVGTTNPLSSLHITGTALQPTSFTGNTPGALKIWGGSYVNGGFSNIDISNSDTGGVIGRIGVSNTGSGSTLHFGTSNNYTNGITNDALSIDPNGNIGVNGSVTAAGANSTYGALTMQGSKNSWSGINFKNSTGGSAGTLMMHPAYSGFYNATDNNWRMYVTDGGAGAFGDVRANDYYSYAAGKWMSGMQARVSGSCAVGQAITAINADGTVTCGTAGGSNFKGLYQYGYNGCLHGNPLTGACSCPAGSSPYNVGTFYLNGFWSSIPDNLWLCM